MFLHEVCVLITLTPSLAVREVRQEAKCQQYVATCFAMCAHGTQSHGGRGDVRCSHGRLPPSPDAVSSDELIVTITGLPSTAFDWTVTPTSCVDPSVQCGQIQLWLLQKMKRQS